MREEAQQVLKAFENIVNEKTNEIDNGHELYMTSDQVDFVRAAIAARLYAQARQDGCPFCGTPLDVNNPETFESCPMTEWGAAVCLKCHCSGPAIQTGKRPVEEWRDEAIAVFKGQARQVCCPDCVGRGLSPDHIRTASGIPVPCALCEATGIITPIEERVGHLLEDARQTVKPQVLKMRESEKVADLMSFRMSDAHAQSSTDQVREALNSSKSTIEGCQKLMRQLVLEKIKKGWVSTQANSLTHKILYSLDAIEKALASQPAEEKKWLIWSIEHDTWWAANHNGYTIHVSAAGRYSYAEALKIVAGANWGSGKAVQYGSDRLAGRPYEAMIREDAYGAEHYPDPRGMIKP